ncbi:MAG TPA: hypothetical protein VH351_10560, partial [Bryobacteraceae bacterium]|nr:hypothetical protein [Bryobacteraceae bacterium]
MRIQRIFLIGVTLLAGRLASVAAVVTPLFSRGYTVIPSPQKVSLGAKDFEFNRSWRLEIGPGIESGD